MAPLEIPASATDDLLLLAIHGVGDPHRGENVRSLAATLAGTGRFPRIEEVFWREWVDVPEYETGYVLEYVARLGQALMNTVCLPVAPPGLSGRARLAACAITTLAPACAVSAAFPLFVLVLWLWGAGWRAAVLVPILTTLALGLLVLITGALAGNRHVFWSAVRVMLLPLIWVPLTLILLFSAIPWGLLIALGTLLLSYYFIIGLVLPEFNLAALYSGQSQNPQMSWWFKYTFGTAIFLISLVPGCFAFWLTNTIWGRLHKVGFQSPTKVLGDVLFYLGDADYRERLLQQGVVAIDKAEASGAKKVIVCAHSLGSVIAVESLCRLVPDQGTEIILVTAGSPLRRLFWRFFPACFPPPEKLHRHLAQRHPRFRWVNVFRPFDYIGTRLSLATGGSEACTWQWLRTHSNYWGDSVPVEKVVRLLEMNGPLHDGDAADVQMPARGTWPDRLRRFRRWASIACLIGLASVFVIRFPGLLIATEGRWYTAASRFKDDRSKVVETRVARYRAGSLGGRLYHTFGMALDLEVLGKHPDKAGLMTLNPYLTDVHQFSSWLSKHGAIVGQFNKQPVYEHAVRVATSTSEPAVWAVVEPSLPQPSPWRWLWSVVPLATIFYAAWWGRRVFASGIILLVGFFFGYDIGERLLNRYGLWQGDTTSSTSPLRDL